MRATCQRLDPLSLWFLLVLCGALLSSGPAAVASTSNPLNDLVHILSGLPVAEDSPYADLMGSAAWQNYHQQITQTWKHHDEQQHAQVAAFRQQWLPESVHQGRDLIYPFAAADFLYADLFFPQARNIYMFGLEPLGNIPGREQLSSAYYQGVIRATEDLLRLTFFRTKAMRDDFRHNGTVPLLCYFIVHRGHTVTDIAYLELDDSGVPMETDFASAQGARIAFQDGGTGQMRNVWYWRGDLSQQALARNAPFRHYIAGLPPSNLYLKAASYLCHHAGFEEACTLFRDRARLSLQEDSGLPLRYYPEPDWERTFFGQYRDPVSVFTDRLYRQNGALRQAYAQTDQVHELPFRLGYHASARADNLMLAIRRDASPEMLPEPPAELVELVDNEIAEVAQPQEIQDRPKVPEAEPLAVATPISPPPPVQRQTTFLGGGRALNPAPSSPSNSPQEQLDAAGIRYRINNAGHLWLIQPVGQTRTQLIFIDSETTNTAGLRTRDVWSVGYLAEEAALPDRIAVELLRENAQLPDGAWEIGRFLRREAAIFRVQVDAEADWETLAATLNQVSLTADRKEQALTGEDEL